MDHFSAPRSKDQSNLSISRKQTKSTNPFVLKPITMHPTNLNSRVMQEALVSRRQNR
jgi:hypothetical protein